MWRLVVRGVDDKCASGKAYAAEKADSLRHKIKFISFFPKAFRHRL
jgi:hypothetical protein